jgi:uncharacterized membrane-anchored protein
LRQGDEVVASEIVSTVAKMSVRREEIHGNLGRLESSLDLHDITSFWVVYVLTRLLGA